MRVEARVGQADSNFSQIQHLYINISECYHTNIGKTFLMCSCNNFRVRVGIVVLLSVLKSLRPEKNGVRVEVVMLISELVVSVNVSDLWIISVVFSVLSFSRRCISPSSCASLIAVRLSGEHSFLASLTPRVWTGVDLL